MCGTAEITITDTPPDTIQVGVDKDYTTIQEAVNAAIDGMTIIVDEGRYKECVVIENKSITLKSTNPASGTVVDGTIIDGDEEGSTVFITGESYHQTVTVEGFTITEGSGSGVDGSGGGVYASIATTILRKNVISGNAAQNGGGGIYARSGKLVLEENTVKDNSSDTVGGGLCLKGVLEATLRDNWIFENTSRDNDNVNIDEGGGGIYANGVNGTWSGNIIENNTAKSGGGLCLRNSSISLIGNQIIDNFANIGYGGIYVHLDYFQEMEIKNNTISGNQAGSYCGGLYLSSQAEEELELVGNTISNNSAFYGGGVYADANVMLTNNIISGNTVTPGMGGGIYVCDSKELTGSGNEFTNNQGYAIYLDQSATWTDEGGNTFSENEPGDVGP